MTRGIQIVHQEQSIPDAKDQDFVMNTNFLSGMKIKEIKTFQRKDATYNSDWTLATIDYPHGFNFVPAYLAFQGGVWVKNSQRSTLPDASVNVDGRHVRVAFTSDDTPITVIIFAEKVADT